MTRTIVGIVAFERKEEFMIPKISKECIKIRYIILMKVLIFFKIYLKGAIELLVNRDKIDFTELWCGKLSLKDFCKLKK